MNKIYTKTGDKGKTTLLNGKIVWKNNERVKAYGDIDELNSLLGLIVSKLDDEPKEKDDLQEIQGDLMLISSLLADPNSKGNKNYLNQRINFMEKQINKIQNKLPVLKNFILPGGTEKSSLFHLARSVCRRAERNIVQLSQKQKVEPEILVFMNRLSDLFFVLARLSNQKQHKREFVWSKK